MTWWLPAIFTLALLGNEAAPPPDKCEPQKNAQANDARRGPVSFPGSVDANTVPPVPLNPPRARPARWIPAPMR
jgi:hypothetical protein